MTERRERPIAAHLRAVVVLAAAACLGWSMYQFQGAGAATAWEWLAAGLVLAIAGQVGLHYATPDPLPPPMPATRRRRLLGAVLAAAGASLWGLASYRLALAWVANFDFAWLGWLSGVALIGLGLDLAWGVWPRPPRSAHAWVLPAVVLVLVAAAGLYRLGNIADFPGEAAITQIEDLQVGQFGMVFLQGYRGRWEYLSSTWLAALGIWLGGPTQMAMRIPFAVVSTLKILPLFLWLRLAVGTVGAVVGSALLVVSFWDVVLSRIPNNHNALIVSIVFALLAGAVRRGRPSAYAWLGFFGGYVLHEYVAYRPLAALALLGAVLYALRDHTAAWPARIARPLLTAVLLCTMVTPLFYTRLPGQYRNEYFDGWNRAKGNDAYYNSGNTWGTTIQQRLERAEIAASLFLARGDHSPVRSIPGAPPLIDPVTALLVVLGIGGVVAHCLNPVMLLTLMGFAVTVTGTLIMTGNFDVARVGGAVPYVYALAGFGAAGIAAALTRAWRWRQLGLAVAALLLAVGVGFAGYWNTRNLFEFWSSPAVKRSHRNNLAYLAVWMRKTVQPGERVLGIAPNYTNALAGHDGSWLRGGEVNGVVSFDVESGLRTWLRERGPTLLFVYDGRNTQAMVEYLEWLLPGVTFTIETDPLEMEADIAYTRLPGPPADLAERLAGWACHGAQTNFSIIGAQGTPIYDVEKVVPFLSKSVWPGAMIDKLNRAEPRPQGIRIKSSAEIRIEQGGDYAFEVETYSGTGRVSVGGQPAAMNVPHLALSAGVHRIEITAEFPPMVIEPNMRVLWKGPDSGNERQLIPFYRIALPGPACAGGPPLNAAAAAGGAGGPPRHYVAEWTGLGTFDAAAEMRQPREAIDVAQLGKTVPGAPAEGWRRLEAPAQFVDLGAAFPFAAADERRRRCAFAATLITAAAARPAQLELSGSADPLRVWLNGRRLTSGWLEVGYAPLHRAVELRAGENSLLVESCGGTGWFFTARLTDEQRADLDGLQVAASLPHAPVALLPPEEPEDVPLVNGFGAAVSAPHNQPLYPDYRGGGPGWWTRVEDGATGVVWRTVPIAERRPTILALTAATSVQSGEAELSVGGRPVLRFPIGNGAIGRMWEADGFEAAFTVRDESNGRSGVLLIGIPPQAITPGEPVELSLRLTAGVEGSWIMIKGHPDTIAHEALSSPAAQEQLFGRWSSAKASPPPAEDRVAVP